MKALCFDGGLRLKEIPTPRATEKDAIVRVILAGICKTDVEICSGTWDFTGRWDTSLSEWSINHRTRVK